MGGRYLVKQLFFSGLFICILVIHVIYADTFIVTNTNDQGEGSLRWAIAESNVHAGPDTIQFNISEQDSNYNGTLWIIRPHTIYEPLYEGHTIIDGASQEINQGDHNPDGPDIMIDGREMTEVNIGFIISSEYNIISGLMITGFQEFGIRLRETGAQFNQIWGNYIGTDGSETDTLGNMHGIYLSRGASYNTIGGESVEKRNIISGNQGDGIRMTSTYHNTVIGNYIGTDKTGTLSVRNAWDGKSSGVYLGYLSKLNIVGGPVSSQRNVISGNGRDGIQIATSDSNTVQGNFIGTDVTGTVLLSNSQSGVGDGIDIRYGASYNNIGGNTPGMRNLICGAVNSGFRIFTDSTHSNIIRGNYIGTDSSGTLNFGNGDDGISIYEGSWGNLIGGDDPSEGNVISGNGMSGICLADSGSSDNLISRNHIGTDANGISAIPNMDHGVLVRDGAQLNHIGPFNQIRFNGRYGIQLNDSTVNRITITQNSIASNEEGGILLLDGANQLVSCSTINSENPLAGIAEPNSTVEVFSDLENQGRIFEGIASADSTGYWSYSEICSGPHITAVVTDQLGNSSEFSESITVSVNENKHKQSPDGFYLAQNYPNPFNPVTTIKITLSNPGHVVLAVYNISGKLVEKLVDEHRESGYYEITFDASKHSSGIYIYKLKTRDVQAQNKMVVMK